MRTHTLILVALTCVTDLLLGAGFLYAHSLTSRTIEKAREHEETIATEWSAFQRAKEFEKGVQSAEGDIARLGEFFVPANGVVPLLELIEEVGRERNVKILIGTVNPSPSDYNSLEWLTVEMQFSGRWSDAIRTVHTLESLPYFGVFERLFMEETQTDESSGWRVIAVLKVLTQAKETGGVSPPRPPGVQ